MDATKAGFVSSKSGLSGMVKLKVPHKIGGKKQYYELKLNKNSGFGKHRVYGRIQLNKKTGAEYILFDTWDKSHRL